MEWFALWNIMCVNMHHTHSDRNNILFLLRSCMNAKGKTEGTEKGKHDAYNTDHRFWPKSLWQPSEGKN